MSRLIISNVTYTVLTVFEWNLAIVCTKMSCEDVFDVLCLAADYLDSANAAVGTRCKHWTVHMRWRSADDLR